MFLNLDVICTASTGLVHIDTNLCKKYTCDKFKERPKRAEKYFIYCRTCFFINDVKY